MLSRLLIELLCWLYNVFQCVYTSNYDFYLIKKRKKREKFLRTRYFTTSRSTCNKYLRFELSTTLNYESILLITRSITNVYYTLNIERYVKKKKKRRDSTIKVKKIVLFLKGFFTVRDTRAENRAFVPRYFHDPRGSE